MTTIFDISSIIPDILVNPTYNYGENTNWRPFVDLNDINVNYDNKFNDILGNIKAYTTTTINLNYPDNPIKNLILDTSLDGTKQNGTDAIEYIELGSLASETFDYRNNEDQSFAVDAFDGANAVYGGSGNNYVMTGIGADTINLKAGDNIIISDAGANNITVTGGDNFISTGLGADNITATDGDNFISAGDGANAITVTSGNNIIITGKGADSITTAGFLNSTINVINAGDGANTITTGAGEDHITGGIHADTITSGAGNDTVFAGDGANTITTGDGNDLIYTGKDVDTVSAGTGNDTIHIYGGTDTISAGTGNDTLIAHFGSATLAVSINALTGDATEATGYSGNISGFGVASFLGVNNFNITSGVAADTITTGAGADVINGGAGADILTGGEGADMFVIAAGDTGLTLKTADTINDFATNSDTIDTQGLNAIVVTDGIGFFNFDAFVTAANASFTGNSTNGNVDAFTAYDAAGSGNAWVAVDEDASGTFNIGDSLVILVGINHSAEITATDFV
jgi:Ca2+-binding RTX toxin-like protein